MLLPADYTALLLTLKLAALSTAVLLMLGTPLAWWLSTTRWRGKFLIEAIVAVPLVLPPTVLGFYLLLAFNPDQWLGQTFQALFGVPLAFSFTGLVFGSVLYSLPFVVQPLQNAFASINTNVFDAAATLRASKIDRFITIAVPLARPGFISAAVLGFAHTLGEFGVVLMIGGNIPGETQVASIAIYEHVETLAFAEAHRLSGVLLGLSLVLLIAVYASNRHRPVLRL